MSKIFNLNAKRPNAVRGTSIENKFVRTSTLATFVPVTNSPDHRLPRTISSDEKCIASIFGRALLEATKGEGNEAGALPTVTFEPIAGRCVAHAESATAPPNANARAATRTKEVILLLVGNRGARFLQRVDRPRMKVEVGRSLSLDYAIGICSVWVASGFFLDAWAHGHVPIETFFTPYHATFYSGMLAMIIIYTIFTLRNRARGFGWRESLPPGYRLSVLGIPIFLLAGIGDLGWHLWLGVEEGVDALLSPTHQALGLGMFFLAMGPIRSVLADRANSTTFKRQLPLVLGLIAWLTLVHFGTAYAFDPGAGRIDAPPSIAHFTPDYLTAITLGYYKVSIGVLILIFQSLLMTGFALWMISRIHLRPGMFTLLFLLSNIPAAAAFTNATPLLLVTVIQSLVAGLVADFLVARTDPQPGRPRAYRLFAVAVSLAYGGTYLIATLFASGLWWDWNVALGAWIWTGLVGFALTLVGTARRTAT